MVLGAGDGVDVAVGVLEGPGVLEGSGFMEGKGKGLKEGKGKLPNEGNSSARAVLKSKNRKNKTIISAKSLVMNIGQRQEKSHLNIIMKLNQLDQSRSSYI